MSTWERTRLDEWSRLYPNGKIGKVIVNTTLDGRAVFVAVYDRRYLADADELTLAADFVDVYHESNYGW